LAQKLIDSIENLLKLIQVKQLYKPDPRIKMVQRGEGDFPREKNRSKTSGARKLASNSRLDIRKKVN
jgi:hypothetical protein